MGTGKTRVSAMEGWFTLDADDTKLLGSQCTGCQSYFCPKETHYCRNPGCSGTEFADVPFTTYLRRVTQYTRGYDVFEGREVDPRARPPWDHSFTVNYELGDVAYAGRHKSFIRRLDFHVLDIIEVLRRLPAPNRAEAKEFRERARAEDLREVDERLAQREQAASA